MAKRSAGKRSKSTAITGQSTDGSQLPRGGDMPRGAMTDASTDLGVMRGNTMSAPGEMPGMAGAAGDGLATSEMPPGAMTAGTGGAAATASDGLATSDMPAGAMVAASGGGMSSGMPSGGMTMGTSSGAQSSEMPGGAMSAAEGVVGAIELPGEWRLILSPVSGQTR